jgi:RNA polymerase sigma-70 factor (ECF subfamily)
VAAPEHAHRQESTALEEALDVGVVFRRYSPYVAAVALRLLGRDEELDDAVQEVFVAALRGLKTLRDPGAVKGWLASVTVRVAQRRLGWRRWRARFGWDTAFDYERVAAEQASPEARAELARVYRCLDELDPKARIAWTLRYVEGERLERVAELTDCSLATVKRRIAAAARALEEALS